MLCCFASQLLSTVQIASSGYPGEFSPLIVATYGYNVGRFNVAVTTNVFYFTNFCNLGGKLLPVERIVALRHVLFRRSNDTANIVSLFVFCFGLSPTPWHSSEIGFKTSLVSPGDQWGIIPSDYRVAIPGQLMGKICVGS